LSQEPPVGWPPTLLGLLLSEEITVKSKYQDLREQAGHPLRYQYYWTPTVHHPAQPVVQPVERSGTLASFQEGTDI